MYSTVYYVILMYLLTEYRSSNFHAVDKIFLSGWGSNQVEAKEDKQDPLCQRAWRMDKAHFLPLA